MFERLGKLYQANLIAPLGFSRLLFSILFWRFNLMAILRYAAWVYPNLVALKDEAEQLTYKDLFLQCKQLATILQNNYDIRARNKVAIVCRNHNPIVKSIIALSCLGADTYLFDLEMEKGRLLNLLEIHDFDLIIYDIEFWELIRKSDCACKALLSSHLTFPSINSLSNTKADGKTKLKKVVSGKLILLKGDVYLNEFNPSTFNYLKPIFPLIDKLNLNKFKTVFIGVPINHEFGLSALLISLVLGKKIILLKNVASKPTKKILLKQQVQVAFLSPSTLGEIIKKGSLELIYLRSIIASGAPLNPRLVKEVYSKLGNKLSNLYGTYNSGFSILATPEELKLYPNTIGKKITTNVRISDKNQELTNGKIGALTVKTKRGWVDTGDWAYVNENGYYFLCGRKEDRIFSNGKNIYPMLIENILLQHEKINQVAIVGISDKINQSIMLKAFIEVDKNTFLSEEMVKKWIKDKEIPFQCPDIFEFTDNIPTNFWGKIDKKVLI